MLRAFRTAGFSLVELMITIAIFAILVMLAGPLYTEFTGNTQIRSAAESVLAGMRTAQAEAVKRNGPVSFVFSPTGWQVVAVEPETLADESPAISTYNVIEGAPKAAMSPLPVTATRLTFSGLGRSTDNPDATPPLTCVKITTTTFPSPHALNVAATPTSGLKMCDPAFALPDPIACPADCD